MYLFVLSVLGSGLSSGKVLQRFPEKDWEDTPFIDGIELVSILLYIDAYFKNMFKYIVEYSKLIQLGISILYCCQYI